MASVSAGEKLDVSPLGHCGIINHIENSFDHPPITVT
jgi:hypothetical protein